MSDVKEKTILKVSFPNEKLEALRFYMGEKELTVEGELQKYMDNIYQKYVPVPTRRYLDRNDNEEELQAETTNKTGKSPGRKRTVRKQNAAEKVADAAINNETIEEVSEQNQEENQSMVISM
ncbi:DUF6103 family protein [Sporanaerobacter acetigenes]|uniref:DUF6103 family protein n=1 Tax=Sporanaerobacter acetigenes TaxID=165813 RepID=UPI001048632F|nr:DUF6103 family protein [Sporanaerobacter acetigenes]